MYFKIRLHLVTKMILNKYDTFLNLVDPEKEIKPCVNICKDFNVHFGTLVHLPLSLLELITINCCEAK